MKLVYVDRGAVKMEFNPPNTRIRFRHPTVFLLSEMKEENPTRKGELFEIVDEDLDAFVEGMAKANPGCNVQVYDLISECICPPAELVKKKITKDGVLPT